jgi:hypothetical protein
MCGLLTVSAWGDEGTVVFLGPKASCPEHAACFSGFREALASNASRIIMLGDVVLPEEGNGGIEPPVNISRDLVVMSEADSKDMPILDFRFQDNGAVIGTNVTVTFNNVLLMNMRCGAAMRRGGGARRAVARVCLRPASQHKPRCLSHTANARTAPLLNVPTNRKGSGIGVDYFAGMDFSQIRLVDVQRWRYMCTNSTSAVASGLSYPRPRGVPGENQITLARQCVRGRCYDDSLLYPDYALHVNPDSTESSEYLPGYSIVLINSTRICSTFIPAACTAVRSVDQCQVEGTDAWLASLRRDESRGRTVAATAAGATSGAAVLGAIAAAVAVRWRRRARERRAAAKPDLEAGTFG